MDTFGVRYLDTFGHYGNRYLDTFGDILRKKRKKEIREREKEINDRLIKDGMIRDIGHFLNKKKIIIKKFL